MPLLDPCAASSGAPLEAGCPCHDSHGCYCYMAYPRAAPSTQLADSGVEGYAVAVGCPRSARIWITRAPPHANSAYTTMASNAEISSTLPRLCGVGKTPWKNATNGAVIP